MKQGLVSKVNKVLHISITNHYYMHLFHLVQIITQFLIADTFKDKDF
jgi:hypothetical protein